MKILFVSQYFYPENFAISNLAFELVREGHEVTVLTGQPNYGFKQILPGYENLYYEVIKGVKIHRVKIKPRKKSRWSLIRNYLSFYFSANRFIRTFNETFDVVYTASLSPLISIVPGLRYAKKHHLKTFLHCLDLWPEAISATGMLNKLGLLYALVNKWSASIYHQLDLIGISSPSFASYLINHHHLSAEKLVLLPQPSLLEPQFKIKKRTNKLVVSFVGNLGKLQPLTTLLEAAELLQKENILFKIVGEGSDSQEVLNLIKRLNLKNVEYLGPLTKQDVDTILKESDLGFLILKDEGAVGQTIPNKLVMYLAYGLPIVGILSGDGAKLIETQQLGLVVINEKNALKEALLTFKNMSDEQFEIYQNKTLSYYQDFYQITKITETLIGYFNRLIK